MTAPDTGSVMDGCADLIGAGERLAAMTREADATVHDLERRWAENRARREREKAA